MEPRFIKLHPRTINKLKRFELKSALGGDYRLCRRIKSVLLNHAQKTSGEIAFLLGTSRSRTSQWLKTYSESGIEGLAGHPHSGPQSRLTDLQKILLCDIIDSGPISYGLTTGIWTSKLIGKVIEYEFSVKYHPSHVWKLLQSLGFSVQSPKRILAKADNEKRQAWIKTTYPAIKKKSKIAKQDYSLKMKPISDKTQPYIELGQEKGLNH